ncbi:MAG: cytochrome c [Bacteroidetes bacterium]|nr:cytochrome c [Bacteroidota bacterium]
MKYSVIIILVLGILVLGISSCGNDPEKPGRIFMPDMAYSKAYETYTYNPNFEDSLTARTPVEGTIPRGFRPYHYENTEEDYERAGRELKNEVQLTEENLEEGKRLYNIYCIVCHGATGQGDGPITLPASEGGGITGTPFGAPPKYTDDNLKDLPEGKIFHSITYGKLTTKMPSYASQLNREERWKVVHFIQTLQAAVTPADVDSSAADVADDAADIMDEANNEDN